MGHVRNGGGYKQTRGEWTRGPKCRFVARRGDGRACGQGVGERSPLFEAVGPAPRPSGTARTSLIHRLRERRTTRPNRGPLGEALAATWAVGGLESRASPWQQRTHGERADHRASLPVRARRAPSIDGASPRQSKVARRSSSWRAWWAGCTTARSGRAGRSGSGSSRCWQHQRMWPRAAPGGERGGHGARVAPASTAVRSGVGADLAGPGVGGPSGQLEALPQLGEGLLLQRRVRPAVLSDEVRRVRVLNP